MRKKEASSFVESWSPVSFFEAPLKMRKGYSNN